MKFLMMVCVLAFSVSAFSSETLSTDVRIAEYSAKVTAAYVKKNRDGSTKFFDVKVRSDVGNHRYVYNDNDTFFTDDICSLIMKKDSQYVAVELARFTMFSNPVGGNRANYLYVLSGGDQIKNIICK